MIQINCWNACNYERSVACLKKHYVSKASNISPDFFFFFLMQQCPLQQTVSSTRKHHSATLTLIWFCREKLSYHDTGRARVLLAGAAWLECSLKSESVPVELPCTNVQLYGRNKDGYNLVQEEKKNTIKIIKLCMLWWTGGHPHWFASCLPQPRLRYTSWVIYELIRRLALPRWQRPVTPHWALNSTPQESYRWPPAAFVHLYVQSMIKTCFARCFNC